MMTWTFKFSRDIADVDFMKMFDFSCNTPLDAELSLLFRYHNAEVDFATYHAII